MNTFTALATTRARMPMKVEDAVTGNTGVWITFLAVVALYAVVGVTTILVLRGMSKRFRRTERFTEHEVPYGPNEPAVPVPADEEPVR